MNTTDQIGQMQNGINPIDDVNKNYQIKSTRSKHIWRKCFGIFWLFIEMILLGGNIFGFSALYSVLEKERIYENYCNQSALIDSTSTDEEPCHAQTQAYENALTLGIALFSLPSLFIGMLIDRFGHRFIKLIMIIFHIAGWLSLALIKPGVDYLLFLHTALTSLSSNTILLTSYATVNYFSKNQAFVATLHTGAFLTSDMWYTIFRVIIDDDLLTLAQLSFIWMSFGGIMFITSFLFLDWHFPMFNLPYKPEEELKSLSEPVDGKHVRCNRVTPSNVISDLSSSAIVEKSKWYINIYRRHGVWEYILSPLYIMLVLFASMVLLPATLLSVIWYPWVYYITDQNKSLSTNYTLALTLSSISSIIICPINGFLIEFRANRSRKQKLLNIFLAQTLTWMLNVSLCIVCIFTTTTAIIPALIIYNIARATIEATCQSVVTTFFPLNYIGTLSGVMYTTVGVITFIVYGVTKLTEDMSRVWRGWIIILILVVLMSCHLVQLWSRYITELKTSISDAQNLKRANFEQSHEGEYRPQIGDFKLIDQ